MKLSRHSGKSAFTLIELIIVIAIIAILAAAIFVAIDPARRLNESRNARRWSDVTTILEAIKKEQADNGGTINSELTADGNYYVLGSDGSGCNSGCGAQTTQAACADLASNIASNYLGSLPYDPSSGDDGFTDYYVSVDANNSVTVGACDPEGEGAGGAGSAPTIELTR